MRAFPTKDPPLTRHERATCAETRLPTPTQACHSTFTSKKQKSPNSLKINTILNPL
ncbi:hypothetical protein PCANC_04218 [Puccinia coronata f. sp. avenae]|uniref:Uncharacterized protein n=1 Tax=Puccinia coronata f. sp. avenae TaxID=200324 RepID=A0A2N5VX80_9BASI|nr:hypothetical protein PCANC_04218 [Puccinia coronata f. sp. avenae]